MIIGACLSPTDPVLAASVLAKSRFSDRVPKRLKNVGSPGLRFQNLAFIL
jgi:NhaP-type Na+/H+ or K+/H+ antiporter